MRAVRECLTCVIVATWLAGTVAAEIVTYRVTRTSDSPTIDGRLDDACWRTACVVDSFGPLGGDRAKVKESVSTRALLTYDADHLYVAYICEEPFIDRLVVNTTEHDGPTWKDDAAEIFFNPSGDRTRYCQIAVNARGTVMDNYGALPGKKLDITYETGAVAASHIGKGEWTLEIGIPFAGLPIEELECPWTFHLARHRAVVPQLYTCLRSPVTGFHAIESFDILDGISLKDRGVAVLDVSLGNLLQGTNLTKLTLRNDGATALAVTAVAGIDGAQPPHRTEAEVTLSAGASKTVQIPWDLGTQHAGRKEILCVRLGDRVIQRRGRAISEVPPVFGVLAMNAYYLDPNELVRLDVPIQLAAGSRGEAQLTWTASDTGGQVTGRGLTTVYGDTAVVRLFWPRWSEGRYTLDFRLTREGEQIASHKEVVRLVQSPWGEY